MRRNYLKFAEQLLNGAWGCEASGPNNATGEQMQIACLMLIAKELRRVRELLECPNITKAMRSLPALESLAREFWVRGPKRRQRKQGREARE